MQKVVEYVEAALEYGGTKKDIFLLVLGGIALALNLLEIQPFSFDIAWVAIVLCGLPIVLEAIIGLVTAFDIKADVLVAMALIAAVAIGEYFAAGEVAFIMQLGALLEDLTVAKARSGIEKLVKLTPQTARVMRSGMETIIPATEVQLNDEIRVLPGETIPVDGIIIKGVTTINQAALTGESLPVDKSVDDEVFSGTINQFGAFTMQATKVGADSSIQRLIKLVQSADADKAKIVGIADRWATWIVVTALVAAALTWFVTGEIIRAVTILVVFCPCALVLATPTAIMAAIGNATKHGFLVREGDALERLAEVTHITFDKTGTLTNGTPTVKYVQPLGEMSESELFSYCAAIEQYSEHPLAKAVVTDYRNQYDQELPAVEDFVMLPGRGVQAKVNGQKVLAGNLTLLEENSVDLPSKLTDVIEYYAHEGCTLIYVAIEGAISGCLALADTVREESHHTIARLQNQKLTPILLTGDNENAAHSIAERLHITEVVANCQPADKLTRITELQNDKHIVCMIGDGINDAPALKKADVGIAMGGIGSDIAVDAADIALINDEIKELPHLMALAKRMMTTIKLNMAFSMALNFAAIILAMTGILNPVWGALVHNAGSVFVITCSALLLNWRQEDNTTLKHKDESKQQLNHKAAAANA